MSSGRRDGRAFEMQMRLDGARHQYEAFSGRVPVGQAEFRRLAFAVPVILGWPAMRGALRTGPKVAEPMGHVRRAVVGTLAMAQALRVLPSCCCPGSRPSAMPRRF
jgi:hypothetical protein